MPRAAIEAVVSVTGVAEFNAQMKSMMGSMDMLATTTADVAKVMEASALKMDAAFGAARLTNLRSVNRELGTMRGHLGNIVSMLGGKGLLTAFGLFEGVKNAAVVATNQMQWQSEASLPANRIASLSRLSAGQSGLGINQMDAGQMIRQIASALGPNTSNSTMQEVMKQAAQLSAISGGKVTSLGMLTALLPAMQSTHQSAPKMAAWINALVNTGNMQTADVAATLSTGSVAAMVGRTGMSPDKLAPFLAFGADTRGGGQTPGFSRNLLTSFGDALAPSTAGQKALASIGINPADFTAMMAKDPQGAIGLYRQALIGTYGPDWQGNNLAQENIKAIFGGNRGSSPIAAMISSKGWGLVQQKEQQFANASGDYTNAAKMAMMNPAQQLATVKAGFSNAVTQIGVAVLPALTAALPTLEKIFHEIGGPAKEGLSLLGTAFKWLANPVVLRTVEGLAALMAIRAITGGVNNLMVSAATSMGNAGGVYGGGGLNATSAAFFRTTASPTRAYDAAYRKAAGLPTLAEEQAAGNGAQVMGGRMAKGFGIASKAATGLTTALIGGAAAYAISSGSTSTSSEITGGLIGILTGAAVGGQVGGPWGAAVGAVGGAAVAIAGHFNAMGKAAKDAANDTKAAISSLANLAAEGSSRAALVSTGLASASADKKVKDPNALSHTLGAAGITQKMLEDAVGDPVKLAQLQSTFDAIKGMPSNVRKAGDEFFLNEGGFGLQESNQRKFLGKSPSAKIVSVNKRAVVAWAMANDKAFFRNYGDPQYPDGIMPGSADYLFGELADNRGYDMRNWGKSQHPVLNYDPDSKVFYKTLPTKAMGGALHSGVSYLVGERGPEMFTPNGSGTLTSNGSFSLLDKGSGGSAKVNHFHGDVHINLPTGTPKEHARAVIRELEKAGARL